MPTAYQIKYQSTPHYLTFHVVFYLGLFLKPRQGGQLQRITQQYTEGNITINKLWAGACEYITENGQLKTLTYLSGPEGVFALHVKNLNGTENIRYIHKDHLGSWHTITDENGNLLQELSFDAWGNRRNPTTRCAFTGTPPAPLFDRGFTGHSLSREVRNGKHLYGFQLINMNGRMYDPLVSRMLSPDNFIQAPDFSQSFNRYNYCWNNPLVYTDPDGEIIFTILATIIPGAQFLLPIAIGADIGWMTGGIRAEFQGETFWSGAWKGLIVGAVGGGLSMIGGAGMPFTSNLLLGTTQGAVTGGLDAALWGNDIGRGMLWGAAGGAVFTTLTSENLKNAIKGEGFYTNENVFNNFMSRPDITCQEIADYFGIDATYNPIKAAGADYVEGTSYFGSTHPIKGSISIGDESFTSYDNLRGTFQKEMFTSNRVLRGEKLATWNDHGGVKELMEMKYYPEEALGFRHAFRNQGLYPEATLSWSELSNFYWRQVYNENLMKDKIWYYIFNKIPRRW